MLKQVSSLERGELVASDATSRLLLLVVLVVAVVIVVADIVVVAMQAVSGEFLKG